MKRLESIAKLYNKAGSIMCRWYIAKCALRKFATKYTQNPNMDKCKYKRATTKKVSSIRPIGGWLCISGPDQLPTYWMLLDMHMHIHIHKNTPKRSSIKKGAAFLPCCRSTIVIITIWRIMSYSTIWQSFLVVNYCSVIYWWHFRLLFSYNRQMGDTSTKLLTHHLMTRMH